MKQQRSKGSERFYGVLLSLGFSSYREYLNSDYWRAIRERVLNLHKRKCLLCPLPAVTIHHTSYRRSVIMGTDLSKLIPLCWDCHSNIEFKGSTKRTIKQAQAVFNRQWRRLPAWVKRSFKKRVSR